MYCTASLPFTGVDLGFSGIAVIPRIPIITHLDYRAKEYL
jgi:hypothetical protein